MTTVSTPFDPSRPSATDATARQRVEVRRADPASGAVVDADGVVSNEPTAADLEADVRRVRAFAKLMDESFEIGGVKVGIDTIIGLIPIVGDTVSALISMYPLHVARKHKLGRWVTWQMSANVAADWAIGLVPFVGDAADVAFKANLRNAKLLEKAAAKKLGRPVGE